ncbi:MAG: hypothetical protein JXR94_18150 [Candidatus Hydrogenedentes bacterium]|nr:hypothetical protein [Candidatus Hydrogenedentota bacterium]
MMKRIASGMVVLVLLGAAAGCSTLNRQPQLCDPTILPAEFKPGDGGVISVKVVDRHRIIARVLGVVKEDPRMSFKLHDDGETPDEKAGDGIWTLQVDVPFMAPPGDFTLELTAYRSNGEAVKVRTKDGEIVPLQTTCAFAIAYPDQPQQ